MSRRAGLRRPPVSAAPRPVCSRVPTHIMRLSRYLLPTLKETPAEAQIASHRLMLRAGLVRQSSAGIYSWLPLGLRVLRNIERIVREEIGITADTALRLGRYLGTSAQLWLGLQIRFDIAVAAARAGDALALIKPLPREAA